MPALRGRVNNSSLLAHYLTKSRILPGLASHPTRRFSADKRLKPRERILDEPLFPGDQLG
jgi:hypothetical protein